MRLPEIDYAAPVQDSARLAPAPYEAASGLAKTISEGLAAYGQELIKTQQQEAAVKVAEGLNQAELAIKARKYVSAQDVRDTFGDNIPKEIQDRLQVLDPATGEMVDNEQIPMWAVGDALYAHAAERLTKAASQGISGVGWQTDFKERVAQHIDDRKMRMASYQLGALDEYLQQTQVQQIDRLTNAGDFAGAMEVLKGSTALAPEVRQKIAGVVEAARQERPALDALTSDNPVEIKAQADRLRSDQAAIAAIPAEKRKQTIAQLDARWQKFEAVGIAQAAFDAGRTPGTLLLDEQKVFAALEEKGRGKVPAVQKDAHALLKQQIDDFNAQRKTVVDKVAAEALSQAMSRGGFSTSLVDPAHKAFLNDPGNGLEAPKFWQGMVERERQLRQLPTDAQAAHLLQLETWMREHPGEVRKLDPAKFAADNFPQLPVPYWNRVNDLFGQIRNPQAPVDVIGLSALMDKRLKEAGLMPAKPTADQVGARNLLTDQLSDWLTAQKSTHGKLPPESEVGKHIDEMLRPVEVRRKFLGIIPKPWTNTTTALEATAKGEKPTFETARPDLLANFRAKGVEPTEAQLRAAYDAWQPKPRRQK